MKKLKKGEFTLRTEAGFHARPAGIFSKLASQFEAKLILLKNNNQNKEYNPKSIISIMTMAAVKGDTITIIANGNDEKEAVNALLNLVNSNFELAN
ncbi:HPr family phosphocarrier protein [Halanaerobium salsuginis]|uniref:HPr family phosphocarrier protein n=1 Tax=Halanaerobium salsuginis TaxID=29563 RepID=UPI003CCB860F